MREIRQIDMERVAYWLRDYLRIRLWKLMQYTQHYLGPTATEVLSPAEKVFAKDHWKGKEAFLTAHLLKYLPEQKRSLCSNFPNSRMGSWTWLPGRPWTTLSSCRS